ncbi:MAG TPA: hypothetical protein VMI54_18600 [Polyangiaceae bacterium]|nr:hypothetical protein [Polyangiaceae bacterium]
MWSGKRSFLSRRRTPELAVALLLAAFVVSSCAGRSTVLTDDDASGGTPAVAGRGGSAGHVTGSGGTSSLVGAGKGGSAGTGDTDVPYTDPGCPDAAAPPATVECSVFDATSSCPAGLGCKPDVEHPYGTGCDQEVLNLRCVMSGPGQQGDACDGGMSDCADGLICVVGASHGARCLRMCPLDGSTRCPSGYVCGPTDADGIGVCA